MLEVLVIEMFECSLCDLLSNVFDTNCDGLLVLIFVNN